MVHVYPFQGSMQALTLTLDVNRPLIRQNGELVEEINNLTHSARICGNKYSHTQRTDMWK